MTSLKTNLLGRRGQIKKSLLYPVAGGVLMGLFVGNFSLASPLVNGGSLISWPGYIAAIRAVGTENVVISSDLGQQGNPIHTDGLIAFIRALSEAGFTESEIDMMTRRNPARFLGVE